MTKDALISDRKDDHLRINLEEDVNSRRLNGFGRYRLHHQALPEINREDVDISTVFLGKRLKAPILVSSMTGGTRRAAYLNQVFAEAAQACGVAFGVGSQRAAIEHPELVQSFNIRAYAPDALVFANLGAVQLNYGFGVRECQQAVDMVAADALILHLNPLQEALQREGETRFAGLYEKIAEVCRQLSVPVIAKEVGWGIDGPTAVRLVDAGVSAIDVAGAGGTSWSRVEMYRHQDPRMVSLAAEFDDWGIPTGQCLRDIKRLAPDTTLIASGGLTNGVELAKAIALGASLGGFARPFLFSANKSLEELVSHIQTIKQTLEICLFACGKQNLAEMDMSVLEEFA